MNRRLIDVKLLIWSDIGFRLWIRNCEGDRFKGLKTSFIIFACPHFLSSILLYDRIDYSVPWFFFFFSDWLHNNPLIFKGSEEYFPIKYTMECFLRGLAKCIRGVEISVFQIIKEISVISKYYWWNVLQTITRVNVGTGKRHVLCYILEEIYGLLMWFNLLNICFLQHSVLLLNNAMWFCLKRLCLVV